jgi:hypothetical protein
MTETTGEVRVRSVRTRQSDSVFEQAMEFGGGVVRLGFSVFTLPLALLPSESRQHMRNATKELMYAFATLPGDFANIAGEAVEQWAADHDDAPAAPGKAPKDELTAK